MLTFTRLSIPICCLLVVLLGYSLSRAMKTWWHRALYFLTLLSVSILNKSIIGIAVTVVPTIVCIIAFEMERVREKAVAHHDGSRQSKFAMFPVRRWDCRTPLVVFDTDQYLFTEDSVYEYIRRLPEDEEARICECRPVFIERVEEEDLLGGTGGYIQLPDAVEQALADLNRAIVRCDPISWEQADIAVDVEDLRDRAKTRINRS